MKGFKSILQRGLPIGVVILMSSTLTWAQATSSISGQQYQPGPGVVNYIEGQVMLDGQSLRPGSVQLQPNQLLETKRGYAEVLLAPGAFLRVGTDSQIRMLSASLADTRIEVVRGEAMIEAADFVKNSNLGVQISGATAQIDRKGLYD